MFSDKVSKAIERYQSDLVSQEIERNSRRRLIEDSAKNQNIHSRKQIDYEGRLDKKIKNTDQELASIEAVYNDALTQLNGADPSYTSINTQKRPHSIFLNVMAITMVVVAITLTAFIPVSSTMRLPAVVISAGEIRTVVAESTGIIHEVLVREGDSVNRGDMLLRIAKKDTQQEAIYRSKLAELKSQESELKTQITESDWLGRNEATNYLDPLHQSVQQYDSELSALRATKQAIQKQLSNTLTRLDHNRALLGQGIIYNEGDHTETLQARLQVTVDELKREIQNNNEEIEDLQDQLDDARGRMQTAQSQRRQELQAALSEIQQSIIGLEAKLEELSFKQMVFDVKTPNNGIIHRLHGLSPGESISPSTSLLELQIPSRKGLLEASLPANSKQSIQVGQAATANFTLPKINSQSIFMGRVKSQTYPSGQKRSNNKTQTVTVEIDIPSSGIPGIHQLRDGMTGQVAIENKDIPLWLYISDWLKEHILT